MQSFQDCALNRSATSPKGCAVNNYYSLYQILPSYGKMHPRYRRAVWKVKPTSRMSSISGTKIRTLNKITATVAKNPTVNTSNPPNSPPLSPCGRAWSLGVLAGEITCPVSSIISGSMMCVSFSGIYTLWQIMPRHANPKNNYRTSPTHTFCPNEVL